MDPQPEPLTVPLPVGVETSATALAVGDALWLWVNEPSMGRTRQFRWSASLEVEELEPLPLVVSGAAACEDMVLVSGSRPDGRAAVLAVEGDGEVRWESRLEGSVPTFWPVVGCAPEPMAAWQEGPQEVLIAAIVPGGFEVVGREPVGGPPLDLAVTPLGVCAVWANAEGVWAAVSRAGGSEVRHLATLVAAEVAVGTVNGRACLAWARDAAAHLATEDVLDDPAPLDLGPAAGGQLTVVSGPRPCLWARRLVASSSGDGESWMSALSAPGRPPTVLEGPVHAVAAWGDRIAVVGPQALRLVTWEAPGTRDGRG